MRFTISLSLIVIFSAASLAQNAAVTEFKESHDTSLALYFYPSTLRMINLKRNPEFDEMIRDLKKARYFKLDSGKVEAKEVDVLAGKLLEDGYEEIMVMKSTGIDIRVLSTESKVPEVVVVSRDGFEYMLLEVIGMINIAKIPKLMEAFQGGEFLDVLNLNKQKNDRHPEN